MCGLENGDMGGGPWDCTGTPCSAFGGGIYNRGTLMMIKNSTLTGNSAGTVCSTSILCRVGVGGAFYSFGGTVTLNNSTVLGMAGFCCIRAGDHLYMAAFALPSRFHLPGGHISTPAPRR